ncbi:PAS domain-containing protein [Hymenobacter sp. NST-14]|uniref:sensor histidine kinase n=1 Tax=Hymenobacter piscis TaxID=2839984 RepID=UPI001C03799E|nr:PAS domain-containing protein [Hymenobacter piscis]MBT9394156.1 PAS domain-containing protein [Hymenobacter piscis]
MTDFPLPEDSRAASDPATPAGLRQQIRDLQRRQAELIGHYEARLRDAQCFRSLFEQNQDAMLLLRDNHFVDCNAAALRLLNLASKAQVLGRHAADFSPDYQPDGHHSRTRADELWAHTLRQGHSRFEWCWRYTAQEECWEDIMQTVVADGQGVLVQATWRDISARKQADRRLQQSEQRLQQALQAAALGLIDWDLATDVWSGDARTQTVLGLAPEPAGPGPGAPVRARLHPADLAGFQALLSPPPAGPPALRELEFRVRRTDGTEGYVALAGHVETTPAYPAGRLLGLVHDRTGHYLTQRELSYKTRLLDHILAHLPVLLARLSPAGEYRELIGAGLRRLQLTDNELAGQSVFEVFPALAAAAHRLLAGEQVNVVSSGVVADEPVHFQQYGFFDAERNEAIMFGIDITDHERRRAELEQQQQFTQRLLDHSIDAIIAFDSELRIIAWNAQTAVMSGIPARQALGRRCAEVIPKVAHDPTFQRLIHQALRGEAAQELSWTGRYYAGQLDMNLLPLALPNLPPGALLIARDVTQREQLRAETTRLKLRQQQLVLSAILTTQEQERRRIAEALHNGVGQLLYATSLHLSQLPAGPALHAGQQLLKEAIRATRSISFELTPRILEDFGLPVALRELTDRVPASPLQLELRLGGLEAPLASPIQIAVYRIVQELLNNMMRHANAHQGRISVEQEPEQLRIRVTDDGVGFAAGAPHPSGGIGLAGVRNRVELLGGTLTITSAPGQGTAIAIRLPLAPPAPNDNGPSGD